MEALKRYEVREHRSSVFGKNPLIATHRSKKLPKRVYRRSPTIRPRSSIKS